MSLLLHMHPWVRVPTHPQHLGFSLWHNSILDLIFLKTLLHLSPLLFSSSGPHNLATYYGSVFCSFRELPHTQVFNNNLAAIK